MTIKKEDLLWIFLNKVPDRFLNTDSSNSGEKIPVQTIQTIPGRFIKTPEKSYKNSVRKVVQDHRVPVRYLV